MCKLADADLAGESINREQLAGFIEYCDRVIAINAASDRFSRRKAVAGLEPVPRRHGGSSPAYARISYPRLESIEVKRLYRRHYPVDFGCPFCNTTSVHNYPLPCP